MGMGYVNALGNRLVQIRWRKEELTRLLAKDPQEIIALFQAEFQKLEEEEAYIHREVAREFGED